MTDPKSILENHFDDPFQRGECENATHAFESNNDFGCQIRVEMAIGDHSDLRDVWWDGRGCRDCEGTASILAELLHGTSTDQLEETVRPKIAFLKSETEDGRVDTASGTQSIRSQCVDLAAQCFLMAPNSPLVSCEDDIADGSQFGGPSLREEC